MRLTDILYRAAAGITVFAAAAAAGGLAASIAVTQPAAAARTAAYVAAPACATTRTTSHRPGGSWSDTDTRQCGDIRIQRTRSRSVYTSGTVSDLTRTRTQAREAGTWITVAQHSVRTAVYATGTVSTTTDDIASCTETRHRHTVYATGRVSDTTTVKPVC